MKSQKRWMKSVIAEAKKDAPALPFSRENRKTVALRRKTTLKKAAA
ncbi:hypothetical protein ACX9MO_01810 [Pseudooceanicola sp. 502str34]|nr:hypothetical protein [Maritimibacter alkaliphilus]MBY6091788.1 hypothetical protein [Maritimibacter alkaliphilus]